MGVMRWTTAVAGLLVGFSVHAAGNLELFVAPDGQDSNSGSSRQQAVRSLAQALKYAQEREAGADDVVIRFAGGSYGDDKLDVNWYPGGSRKLILTARGDGGRAVFDGNKGAATWLVIRGKRGEATNVVVQGFDVRNYRSAVAVYGDRFDSVPWSSGNRIEDNVFQNIGQFTSEVKPSFAALTLSNSHDNVIIKNTFKNIRNIEKCDGLHAIYISGGSDNNRVVENVFDGGCGDTIKARDRSNDNVIRNNEFRNQEGKSLFVDSFCDGAKIAECAEKQQECPSWNNEFSDNKVDAVSRRSVKAVTRTVGRPNIPSCPLPPRAKAARIIEKQ